MSATMERTSSLKEGKEGCIIRVIIEEAVTGKVE